MSNFQIPQPSIAGGPTIEFAFAGDVCTAELAGAKLRAERLDDEHADLRLHDATGKVLASVVVSKLWDDESITVSVMNIGSALLWSHVRWLEAQAGGQPEDQRPARLLVGPLAAAQELDR